MSARAPAATAATATGDVADPLPSPSGARPFCRPAPADRGRPTPGVRGTAFAPFLAPVGDPAARASRGVAAAAPIGVTSMTSPGRAELDAADALVAVVGRLRVGTLRLPAAVDGASPSAVLAAVLVALHAEATADAAPAVELGSAR